MSPVHPDASPHAGEAATTAQRRADALRRAARAKHEAAAARAEAAIRQLVKNQQDISFRSVARTGGISLDFLYASTDLRRRIESLRAQQAGQVPAASAGDVPAAAADGGIVQVLTVKLREERASRRTAVHDIEQQLAAAHGEILRLRRLLQQHGVQP
jgi:hypothetical protein